MLLECTFQFQKDKWISLRQKYQLSHLVAIVAISWWIYRIVKPSMNSRNKVVLALFAFSLKTSLKKESPNVSVANCVSSLTYRTGILWLNIFTNPDSWSAESRSKVPKLLYKQSPSTRIWSKSHLPRWNICFIWTHDKAYTELHAHCMLTVSPNSSLIPWWNEPYNTLSIF